MKRRKAREIVIQTLYQMDVSKADWREALQNILGDQSNEFLERVLPGISSRLGEIDEEIRQHLINWSLERLSPIDRSILRLGIFELKYMDDIPNQVAINEAVELAKTFGSEESPRFVNGLLSSVVKQGV